MIILMISPCCTLHPHDIIIIIIISYYHPYPRTCLLILERGEGGERERNIDWLLLVCALTGDQTDKLWV